MKDPKEHTKINPKMQQKKADVSSSPTEVEIKVFSTEEQERTEEINEIVTEADPGKEQSRKEANEVVTEFDPGKQPPPINSQQIQPDLKKTSEEERYIVIQTLGEGGMGIVQRVKDSLLEREVALKKIKMGNFKRSSSDNTQQIMLWRLQREASIMAFLEHPNIIPLYDILKKEEEELCFTMRKVEGATFTFLLNQARDKKIVFDENKRLSVFLKVCDALSYAHSKEVVHRDLKPDNIMVGKFGEVYVMDWGIAKKLAEPESPFIQKFIAAMNPAGENRNQLEAQVETEVKSIFQEKKAKNEPFETIGGIGTPGYMPPEQSQDAALATPQSDIFALGKILEQCFTLFSPMEKFQQELENALEKKENKKFEELPIPLDIQAIIKKAIIVEKTQRYQNVQQMVSDIEKYQKNLQISVRKYSLLEKLDKWLKRNKQKVVFGSVILSLCIFFPLYFNWTEQQNQQEKMRQEFELAYQEANKTQQFPKEEKTKNKEELRKRLQLLLNGLYQVNRALTFKPKHQAAEELKYAIGKEIIALCCKSEDYQLAYYVSDELKNLSFLSQAEKQTVKASIYTEQTKLLAKHKRRFAYWKNVLKDPTPGMREAALLEISKMQEEEILEELLQLLADGTQYFLAAKQKTPKISEYYEIMVTALGQLENPKAGTPLLNSLQKMTKKNLKANKSNREFADIHFMAVLTNALGNSNASHTFQELKKIYQEMEVNLLFKEKTNITYQKLLLHLLEYLSKVIKANPQNVNAYNSRGHTKMEMQEFKSAILDYNKAIQIDPQNAEAYVNRGLAKSELKDQKGAILDFDKGIQINPKFVRAYINRGVTKSENGDFKGAIEDSTSAIRLDSQCLEAYLNRGLNRYKNGDLKGAIQDLNKAIELNPFYTMAYLNRGNIKQEIGNFSEALKDYDRVIHLNPQHYDTYNNRGLIKYRQKDFEGAIQDYNQAIKINSQFAKVYNNRGLAKNKSGDLKGSVQDYTEAIRLDSKFIEAYMNRGIAHQQNENEEAAIKDFNVVIQINPQFAKAYNARGFAKKNINDLKGALKDFNKAIELDPQFMYALYNSAYTYLIMGNNNEGIALFEKIINIKFDPETATELSDLLLQRMIKNYRKKEFKLAQEDLLRFKKYAPEDHPKRSLIVQMQQEIEKQLKQLEKKK